MFRWGFKRCIAWTVVALGLVLILTVLPSAWLICILGIALIAFGCKLMF